MPVCGVPVPSQTLRGQDSLYSIVQRPKGVPVATFADWWKRAPLNLYAAQILSVTDATLADKLAEFRKAENAKARVTTSSRIPNMITKEDVLLPGETLGFDGGGQLGRMFAQAAATMGYHVAVIEPGTTSPAGEVSREGYQRQI